MCICWVWVKEMRCYIQTRKGEEERGGRGWRGKMISRVTVREREKKARGNDHPQPINDHRAIASFLTCYVYVFIHLQSFGPCHSPVDVLHDT